MKRAVLLALFPLTLLAQPAAKTPTEESTIQRFRAHAKPRQVASQAPLSAEERNTIRRFKEAKPSVVYVTAIAPVQDLRTMDTTKAPQGSGTGFVWDEWGHVVTNHHVITVEQGGMRVGEVDEVEVTLADGKVYKGRVIGSSFAYDISVLQVFAPLESMPPIPVGKSRNLQVGQSVMAIGNPFGLEHSLTKGVISSMGREIDTGYGTRILNAIQTDAAVNPGNSGGPLLDSGGRLIGMNTAIAAATGASVGIGFAIPVDTLNQIVPRLIAKGRLDTPRMGIETLNEAYALQNFGVKRGLVILEVEANSPAHRAGLRPLQLDEKGVVKSLGDILIAYQGRLIENNGQFRAMLELEPVANEVVFDVLRDGAIIKVTLHLDPAKPKPKSI
ncbi:MAG TPA: trypsin-like peptidase domain-containing protein [Geothrix sp.]|nr:trypsin-like peptidase domain-containing protein [Geothrix sp.]